MKGSDPNLTNGKKKEVYLDHAATTYMDPRVFEAMKPYFMDNFGNPGSFNTIGLAAKEAVDKSRETIARILNCRPNEIIFTSGGTESNNLAVQGVAKALKNKGRHIITEKAEHHAVLEVCEALEKEGYEITYLDVDKYGMVSPGDVQKAIREDTILISIMYANNEIGTIQPIAEIGEIARKHRVYFHVDACQAAGALDLDVKKLNVDLMAVNGAKIYGPKGVGCLFVRQGVQIQPIIFGGGQENKLRSGTENVPGIAGFAKALELAQAEKDIENKRLINLRDKLINGVLANVPKTLLNGHPAKRLPNNANITFLDVEGEAVLLYMNEFGICASSGSACTSKTLDPSHVIMATGVPYEVAHGSIRFTLGRRTTEEDIDHVLGVLPKVIEILRKISPVNLGMEQVISTR